MGTLKMCILIMKTNNVIPHVFILAFSIESQATRYIILSLTELITLDIKTVGSHSMSDLVN